MVTWTPSLHGFVQSQVATLRYLLICSSQIDDHWARFTAWAETQPEAVSAKLHLADDVYEEAVSGHEDLIKEAAAPADGTAQEEAVGTTSRKLTRPGLLRSIEDVRKALPVRVEGDLKAQTLWVCTMHLVRTEELLTHRSQIDGKWRLFVKWTDTLAAPLSDKVRSAHAVFRDARRAHMELYKKHRERKRNEQPLETMSKQMAELELEIFQKTPSPTIKLPPPPPPPPPPKSQAVPSSLPKPPAGQPSPDTPPAGSWTPHNGIPIVLSAYDHEDQGIEFITKGIAALSLQ